MELAELGLWCWFKALEFMAFCRQESLVLTLGDAFEECPFFGCAQNLESALRVVQRQQVSMSKDGWPSVYIGGFLEGVASRYLWWRLVARRVEPSSCQLWSQLDLKTSFSI